jgi:putative FmdB family regulatory protein
LPLYAYRCTQCGHLFEKIQNFSADAGVSVPQMRRRSGAAIDRARPQLQGRWLVCQRLRRQKLRARRRILHRFQDGFNYDGIQTRFQQDSRTGRDQILRRNHVGVLIPRPGIEQHHPILRRQKSRRQQMIVRRRSRRALRRQQQPLMRRPVLQRSKICSSVSASAVPPDSRTISRMIESPYGLGTRRPRQRYARSATSGSPLSLVVGPRHRRASRRLDRDHLRPLPVTQPSCSISSNAFHMPIRPTPPPVG